ncbi:MAG: methyltransferase domain-containing protein [Terriglobia bacterium]
MRSRYEQLVWESCSEQPFAIPSAVQRYFNNAYSFEYVTAIREFVGDAQRVLIVGDGAGRDYYSLKLLGKKPVVMDIASQSTIPEFVIGDANLPLPFADGTFDAVVMAEVLEHLSEDYQALRRVRDLVKDGGVLVLTVPYYHDDEITHVRIHSPASIERLLRASGWQIVSYVEKGGGLCRLVDWFPVRLFLHVANLIVAKYKRRTFYQSLYRRIAPVDFWLGRRRHSLHRYSKLYGAFVKCTKTTPTDWSVANARAFQNMHRLLVR